MRALERGEFGPEDDALVQHLDACLGCRGCEPVCPSGVAYGRGLEAARERLYAGERAPAARARGAGSVPAPVALAAALHGRRARSGRPGLPRRWRAGGGSGSGWGCSRRPAVIPSGARDCSPCVERRVRRSLAPTRDDAACRMTVPPWPCSAAASWTRSSATSTTPRAEPSRHNGYRVVEVDGQACCGALHEHAGDRDAAVALARLNVAALADTADYVVVNSAGCGALLKDYGHLLGDEVAAGLAEKVRDVARAPCRGGPEAGRALWSWTWPTTRPATCSMPSGCMRRRSPCSARSPASGCGCCPVMTTAAAARASTRSCSPAWPAPSSTAKIEAIAAADPRPAILATGNPGCLMQIGAGLLAAGLDTRWRTRWSCWIRSYAGSTRT